MSSEDENILRFDILEDPEDHNFYNVLKHSHLYVNKQNVIKYLNAILAHFAKGRLHTREGNTILECISKILVNDSFFVAFAEGGFIDRLPFAEKQYRDNLLDLLYILAANIPQVFDLEVAGQLSYIVDSEPRKCLTIIGIFARSFEYVSNPFPMIDILFRKCDEFKTVECAVDYICLLIYMLDKYTFFRQERIQHCWTYICDMLSLTNVAIINTCYYGLCAIAQMDYQGVTSLGYPILDISRHVKRRPLQDASFSLLIRCTPPSDTPNIRELLLSLITVAQEDEKATLILMSLASDASNALRLLQNPEWMTKKLPKVIDTMKLFCTILLHKELRELVVKTPMTIDFFRGLLSENSVGMCNSICTMLRRMPLTPEFVSQLSEQGFLSAYFASILENEEEEVLLSALRLLDTLSRIKYVRELSEMMDTVIRLIKKSNGLTKTAAIVAINLCKYPRCAKIFKAKRLDEFFSRNEDPKLKKYAEKFLEVLAKAVHSN